MLKETDFPFQINPEPLSEELIYQVSFKTDQLKHFS